MIYNTPGHVTANAPPAYRPSSVSPPSDVFDLHRPELIPPQPFPNFSLLAHLPTPRRPIAVALDKHVGLAFFIESSMIFGRG